MSREPSYPKDAQVGTGGSEGPVASGKASPVDGDGATPEEKSDSRRAKHLMTGAAIGIGSAAIVAALLWASRSKKNDKDNY